MTNDNKNRFGVLLALVLTVALTACDANPRKEAESRGEAGSAPCLQKTPQGLCIIELGVSGAAPVRFETEAGNLQRLPDGSLHVANRLLLVMPDVRWTLTEASVTFKPAADGKGFDRILGEARIPFDKLPILDKAKTGGGVMAALWAATWINSMRRSTRKPDTSFSPSRRASASASVSAIWEFPYAAAKAPASRSSSPRCPKSNW